MEKQELKPAGVFKYFAEICQVPRPSKKEEKIIAYLKAFGEKHNLETKVDEAGNVLIKKLATPERRICKLSFCNHTWIWSAKRIMTWNTIFLSILSKQKLMVNG